MRTAASQSRLRRADLLACEYLACAQRSLLLPSHDISRIAAENLVTKGTVGCRSCNRCLKIASCAASATSSPAGTQQATSGQFLLAPLIGGAAATLSVDVCNCQVFRMRAVTSGRRCYQQMRSQHLKRLAWKIKKQSPRRDGASGTPCWRLAAGSSRQRSSSSSEAGSLAQSRCCVIVIYWWRPPPSVLNSARRSPLAYSVPGYSTARGQARVWTQGLQCTAICTASDSPSDVPTSCTCLFFLGLDPDAGYSPGDGAAAHFCRCTFRFKQGTQTASARGVVLTTAGTSFARSTAQHGTCHRRPAAPARRWSPTHASRLSASRPLPHVPARPLCGRAQRRRAGPSDPLYCVFGLHRAGVDR